MGYDYERRSPHDYDRRVKVANADEQLVEFDRILERAEHQATELLSKPEDRYTPHRIGALVKSMFSRLVHAGAQQLFLEVLRTYEMRAHDRKVIEHAAKTFSKTRLLVKPAKALETYEKTIYEYKSFSATAWATLRTNERHTDEGATTTVKVGSFMLVNTGGFDEKVMAEATKVVTKSEALLRKKGLGRVCYGDVHITNTVYKGTRTLAFYMLDDDRMYIRANLKGKVGPAITSVLHELGHRLQFRFLRSKKRDIDALYRSLGDKQSGALHDLLMDRSRWPKAGDTYVYKGETFLFERVDLSRRSKLEALFKIPGERFSLRVPLSGYIAEKDPAAVAASQTYVTNYASTDPDENLAEMVAYYCEDKLPEAQIKMLEEVIQ